MLDRARARFARRMIRLALLADVARQQTGEPADLTGTIEAQTVAGYLYLPAEDDYITPTLVEDGEWEPGETAIVRARLRPGDTFVDIGAHVGYFSCLAGRLVGPRGLVLAFEPHPRNYELLLANLWRNGLSNVVAFPWAIVDVPGFAELFTEEGNTGGYLLYEPPGAEQAPVRVRTAALDKLEAIRPPLDFVKVDTQGADDLAVRGMTNLIARSPGMTLLVEFWPFGIRLRGENPRAVLDYYRSLGPFTVYRPPDGDVGHALSNDEILAYCNDNDGRLHVNLVLSL
jgi:FkbM family methyltransferase